MLNCDYLQGYHYGAAMDIDELIAFRARLPVVVATDAPAGAGDYAPELERRARA